MFVITLFVLLSSCKTILASGVPNKNAPGLIKLAGNFYGEPEELAPVVKYSGLVSNSSSQEIPEISSFSSDDTRAPTAGAIAASPSSSSSITIPKNVCEIEKFIISLEKEELRWPALRKRVFDESKWNDICEIEKETFPNQDPDCSCTSSRHIMPNSEYTLFFYTAPAQRKWMKADLLECKCQKEPFFIALMFQRRYVGLVPDTLDSKKLNVFIEIIF